MQFERLPDIVPVAGAYSLTAQLGCVYSLTTTTGQKRGGAFSPAATGFPMTHFDEFEDRALGTTPPLWADFAGVFDVASRAESSGKALRQILTARGIEWLGDTEPVTILGEPTWTDFSIAADCLAESAGYLALAGRIASIPEGGYKETLPGYMIKVHTAGTWELRAKDTVMASGNPQLLPEMG